MKKLIGILICLIGLASCQKEILNSQPLDIISDAALWNDPILVDTYLSDIYAEMTVFDRECNTLFRITKNWSEDDIYCGLLAPNLVSDECRDGYLGSDYSKYKFGLNINGGLFDWWDKGYSQIRKCNEFIARVPTSPLDLDLIKGKVAEARFLRAFAYFSLVKRYGGVPLITKAQGISDPKAELYPKRNSEESVYNFVLSEIDTIVDFLPETVSDSDIGRPSKYAALALKSRAALYAGSIAQFGIVQLNGVVGIDQSKASSFYQKSYNASQQIINSGLFALYNKYPGDKVKNYRQLFLDKFNSEVIFAKDHNSILFNSGGLGTGFDFFNAPNPNGWGGGSTENPYLEMVEQYEHIDGSSGKLDATVIQNGLWTMDELWANKDPRFFATIYTNQTQWKGKPLDYHSGILLPDGSIETAKSYNGILPYGNQNVKSTCFGVLKYLYEDNNGNWGNSQQCFQIFRYGEILLNYAEAAFELGKTGDALNAVNQIRDRAGIAQLGGIDRYKIRHERQVELAFETQRYFDTRRWRTAVHDLSLNGSGLIYILDYNTLKYKLQIVPNFEGTVNPPVFFEKNYYLPITLARTGANPNLLENPGY
jgi:hypothetical protein